LIKNIRKTNNIELSSNFIDFINKDLLNVSIVEVFVSDIITGILANGDLTNIEQFENQKNNINGKSTHENKDNNELYLLIVFLQLIGKYIYYICIHNHKINSTYTIPDHLLTETEINKYIDIFEKIDEKYENKIFNDNFNNIYNQINTKYFKAKLPKGTIPPKKKKGGKRTIRKSHKKTKKHGKKNKQYF